MISGETNGKHVSWPLLFLFVSFVHSLSTWKIVVAILTECGFLHFFPTFDRNLINPVQSINLREAEVNSDLAFIEVKNPESSMFGVFDPPAPVPQEEISEIEDCCFEIAIPSHMGSPFQYLPIAFLITLVKYLRVRSIFFLNGKNGCEGFRQA